MFLYYLLCFFSFTKLVTKRMEQVLPGGRGWKRGGEREKEQNDE
jgi:hypothetical protein